jgi:hypothetical protein
MAGHGPRSNFFDPWVEHYAKVEEDDRQRLPLKAVHFLAPPEY